MTGVDLKHFRLLTEFSEEEREAFADLLEDRELLTGKSAFREGSESDGLVLLVEGRLKLRSKRTGADLGMLEAPDHLGGVALFALGKREITAVADGGAKIRTLARADLPRLAEDAPRAAFRLVEAIARELAGLTRRGLDALVKQGNDFP